MALPIYLVITPYFPSDNSHVGVYIYDQVVALRKQLDCNFVIIKTVPPGSIKGNREYVFDKFRCIQFGVIDLPSYILPGILTIANMFRFRRLVARVVNGAEVRMIHAHCIYPSGYLALQVARQCKAKVLLQHHGLDIIGATLGRAIVGFLRTLNTWYLKKRFLPIIKGAALNVGVSEKVVDNIYSLCKLTTIKCLTLYNGVDTEKFFKISGSSKSGCFTIGCIGNFIPIKGQMTLLDALRYSKEKQPSLNIKTIMVGTGPTLDTCKSFVRDHVLDVEFISAMKHDELNEFYNTLDLFVLPSYYEALGCVYMEALQIGIPVVGVKGMGIEEVLQKEDVENSLIDKNDYVHLAKLIEFRLSNKEIEEYDFDINFYIKDFIQFLRQQNLL